jgi:hypothetical protein
MESLQGAGGTQPVLLPDGVNDGDQPITWMGEEMTDADAHLIASAPDLYAALEEARLFIEDQYISDSYQDAGEWLAPEARALHSKICSLAAKARGES